MHKKRVKLLQPELPFSLVTFQALFPQHLLFPGPLSLGDHLRYELRQTEEGLFFIKGNRRHHPDSWHLSSSLDLTLVSSSSIVITTSGPSFIIRGVEHLYRAQLFGDSYYPFTGQQVLERRDHYFRYGSSFRFRLTLS